MATTPGGLPYPAGTDQLKDGDNAIQALALAVEGKYGTRKLGLFASVVTTGSDGRYWASIPALTNIQAAICACPGTAQYEARAYQYSTGSVLVEVYRASDASIVANASVAVVIFAWGT